MSNLSINTKFGQILQVPAGSAAIAQNDFIEIGGPGNEAFSVTTMDYAIPSAGVAYNTETSICARTPAGYMRQTAERDKSGNFYILGMNSSGNLTVTKFSPQGFGLPGTILDSGTTTVISSKILALSNGTFAAVYARATGALYFVIFDSSLNVITSPAVAIANEYYTGTNVTYHDAVALAGGGFAVVYQLAITGTQILLQTFTNQGVGVVTATNVQTLSGSLALAFLRILQLPNGNLLVVMRSTMTPVGTSFVIVNTSGGSVVTNVVVDSGSTLGLVNVDFIQANGTFAISSANGTSLICGVFNQVGAAQGINFSTSDTLNSSTQKQVSLCNDGARFWLTYISSAGNGINIIQIPTSGTGYVSTLALNSGTIASTNFSLDATIINGLLTVFAASTLTGGQYWMTFGLPDASVGTSIPYVRTPALSFGTSAATTGCWWPRILNVGDWVGIFIYDRQNVQGEYFAIIRTERGALLGISQTAVAAGNQGTLVSVNPGPGTYPCGSGANPSGGLIGTSGLQYNQGSSPPFGNVGTLFSNGVTMQGIAFTPGPFVSLNAYPVTGKFGSGQFQTWSTPGTYQFIASSNLIRVRVVGSGQSGGPTPGSGGTTSFGSLISATGGTGSPGSGFGGQFQATGGTGGTGSGHNGGGGGAAGSVLGTGGNGGNSATASGGGGGAVGGNAGATGTSTYGGGGAGSLTGGNGYVPGAATDGTYAFGDGVLPSGFVSRFPFDNFGGSGGMGGPPKGVDLAGYNGAIGGGGGGALGISVSAPGGAGGQGGGGGGGAGVSATGAGGAGGIGAGGGGAGSAGGNGGGFAIGVFPTSPGTAYTVTIPAGGIPGGAGGAGGPGSAIAEW